METQASTKQDALNKARSFLARIYNESEKGRGVIFQDSREAAQTLCCTIDLLQSLQRFLVKGSISWDPSYADWKVVNTVLELLIRLGIAPHLSPGVGLRRDKQLEAFSCPLLQDFSGVSLSNPSLQNSACAPPSGLPVLFVCAEVLASFLWHTTSSSNEVPRSLPSIGPPTCLDEAGNTDAKMDGIPKHDFDASTSSDGSKLDMNRKCASTNSIHACMLLFPPIAQLAMKCFLWDLMAAYLQLGFGPKESGEDVMVSTQNAKARLNHMIKHFPVEQMIVASFVLLNRESPAPPPWLKAELGKQLSKLVMRSGGLITIIEELVGRVTKGNVESYERVAGHLAKVPKSVATADEYFKAICPQVLPLLLEHKPKDVVLGETSLTALSNIHHTAVLLTCKLFSTEPALAKKYLVQPLRRPLLALKSMQNEMDMVGGLSLEHLKEQHIELPVTENEVVDSFVQLGVLLTAGSSQGSSAAREAVLLETRGIAAILIKLHFQLSPNEDLNLAFSHGSGRTLKDANRSALESKGISGGFLQSGLGVDGSDEQAHGHQSTLSKLKSSLTDIVMAEMNQSVELALPCLLSFLLDHEMEVVRWPQEGEVWKALQFKGFHSGSKATYLSRMLLMVENFSLVLALMGELLHKILNLRRALIKSNGSKTRVAADLLRYVHDFEQLNKKAGTKALEHDAYGASSLLKALLDDELVSTDEDVLELVLHMVHSLLKGLRSSRSDDAEETSSGCRRVHGLVLTDLLSSLERVYSNGCISEKLRQMCFTLGGEVSILCKAS